MKRGSAVETPWIETSNWSSQHNDDAHFANDYNPDHHPSPHNSPYDQSPSSPYSNLYSPSGAGDYNDGSDGSSVTYDNDKDKQPHLTHGVQGGIHPGAVLLGVLMLVSIYLALFHGTISSATVSEGAAFQVVQRSLKRHFPAALPASQMVMQADEALIAQGFDVQKTLFGGSSASRMCYQRCCTVVCQSMPTSSISFTLQPRAHALTRSITRVGVFWICSDRTGGMPSSSSGAWLASRSQGGQASGPSRIT